MLVGKTAQGQNQDRPQQDQIADIQREHVAKMLAYFEGDRAKAAEALGMGEEEMETILNGAP